MTNRSTDGPTDRQTEVGIYERKQESKKKKYAWNHAIDQENKEIQEKKTVRKKRKIKEKKKEKVSDQDKMVRLKKNVVKEIRSLPRKRSG